jgi:hypothetical protein
MSAKIDKHLKQTLTTYVYSHCNICNIPIYFYNIHLNHLQHTSETYVCSIGGAIGANRFRPSGWEPVASSGVRAPQAPPALVGAPWLSRGQPEGPWHVRLAAIGRGSGPWRRGIPMTLG